MEYTLALLSEHWPRLLGVLILAFVLFGGSMTPWLKAQWARLTTRAQSVPVTTTSIEEDPDVLDMLAIKRLRARKTFKGTEAKEALDTLMTHFFNGA